MQLGSGRGPYALGVSGWAMRAQGGLVMHAGGWAGRVYSVRAVRDVLGMACEYLGLA